MKNRVIYFIYFLFFSFKGRRECFVDDGSLYKGTKNYSMSGKPCIHWFNVTDEDCMYDFIVDDDNYCRNTKSKPKPRCWVHLTETGTSHERIIEDCDIPVCGMYLVRWQYTVES